MKLITLTENSSKGGIFVIPALSWNTIKMLGSNKTIEKKLITRHAKSELIGMATQDLICQQMRHLWEKRKGCARDVCLNQSYYFHVSGHLLLVIIGFPDKHFFFLSYSKNWPILTHVQTEKHFRVKHNVCICKKKHIKY